MKKTTNLFLIIKLIIFSLLISCEKSNQENNSNNKITEFNQGTICSPQIMSYHFGVEDLPISEQITTLSNLEMNGLIVQIETNNLNDLDLYYNESLVKSGEFNIYNVFTTITTDSPEAYSQQLLTIEQIYEKIQFKNTQLQILIDGNKDNPNLDLIISDLANIANKYKKSIIIYPHEGLAVETAEEALSLIKNSDKNNIFLSVHLCHELAAGNGNRIMDVIKNVAPYIKSISISGASLAEKSDTTLPLWYWGIKPLSMGTYDYNSYYQALHTANYKGPIAIHTWGIFDNFNLPIEDHIINSKELILNMSKNLCD